MFKVRMKSLFWKIFLAVWLANTVVMLMTTFVVFRQIENSHYIDRYRQHATEVAELVIAAHEAGQALPSFRHLRDNPHLRRALGALRHHQFVVKDAHNEVIFKWRPRASHKSKLEGQGKTKYKNMRIQLVGEQGGSYTVVTNSPDIPRFLVSAIQRLNTVQMVLISLSSAVVSLLLSWLITRPMRTLGHFSRRFSDANYQNRIDESLLNRGDEIGDLARDFDTMARQVDQHFQQQQQLLYDVSHELRAPLARMQALAALMELTPIKDEGEQSKVQRIEVESQRMNTLIQQILDYARLEKDARKKTETDIVALITEAVNNTQLQYPTRKILCVLNQKEIRWSVHADLLIRAIENILGNACKHTPDDTPIELHVRQEANTLHIDIQDHGQGIDEAEREQLLQPFYRAGNAMQSEGFGLGLSIVTRAVKLHNGKIELNNHEQGGLIVCLSLPK